MMNRDKALDTAKRNQLAYVLQTIEIQANKGFTSMWYEGILFNEVKEMLKSPEYKFGVMQYDDSTEIIWG